MMAMADGSSMFTYPERVGEGQRPQLEVSHLERDGEHTLALSGELNMASSVAWEHATDQMVLTGARRVVIDLRRLAFLDSCGLRCTLSLHLQCAEQQIELRILPGPAIVQRVFEVSGVADRLPFLSPVPDGAGYGAWDSPRSAESELSRASELLTERIDEILKGSELDTADPDQVAAVAQVIRWSLPLADIAACRRLGVLHVPWDEHPPRF